MIGSNFDGIKPQVSVLRFLSSCHLFLAPVTIIVDSSGDTVMEMLAEFWPGKSLLPTHIPSKMKISLAGTCS